MHSIDELLMIQDDIIAAAKAYRIIAIWFLISPTSPSLSRLACARSMLPLAKSFLTCRDASHHIQVHAPNNRSSMLWTTHENADGDRQSDSQEASGSFVS